MAQCPVCQAENAEDFGLVNCRSCGSPFFIDMDGSASASPSADSAPQPFDDSPAESVVPSASESEMEFGSVAADVAPERTFSTEPPPLEPYPAATEFAAQVDLPSEILAEHAPVQPPEPLEPAAPEPKLEDLREIARFGNSEESLAREGAYRMTIYIRGIDTAEIRQEIRHLLNDSRFLWNIDALLDSIVDGELVLKDISAVKAALAVQRLKTLPVELKWEQHAIHRSPTP